VDDAGAFAARDLVADGRGDGAAAGPVAPAAGELAAAGAPAALFAGLPWLGVTVSTTAAVAAPRTRSVAAAAIIPVRKLTSSSRALMAARMPGREPAIR
jgi:hypothetical protein